MKLFILLLSLASADEVSLRPKQHEIARVVMNISACQSRIFGGTKGLLLRDYVTQVVERVTVEHFQLEVRGEGYFGGGKKRVLENSKYLRHHSEMRTHQFDNRGECENFVAETLRELNSR